MYALNPQRKNLTIFALSHGGQVHVEVTPRGSRIREPAPKAMQHLCVADLVPPEELLRRLRLQVTPAPICVHRGCSRTLHF